MKALRQVQVAGALAEKTMIEHILSEHAHHNDLVQELRNGLSREPPDIAGIRANIKLLDDSMTQHLRDEEVSLFPWLAQTLPEAAGEIERLLKQHEELSALSTSVRLGLDVDVPSAHALAQARVYAALIQSHTAHEQTLVGTAMAAEGAKEEA